MKVIVKGNTENKVYEVMVFETPPISEERDPVRRARMVALSPKRLPSFHVTAPGEDEAKQLVKEKFARQRRLVRAFSRTPQTDPSKYAGTFIVYVEPVK